VTTGWNFWISRSRNPDEPSGWRGAGLRRVAPTL